MRQIQFLGQNTNTKPFGSNNFSEYKYKYISVEIIMAHANKNIFESNFLDTYKYFKVYQTLPNMNRNAIIGAEICKYE